jgi:cytochrome c oxidase assembly protein subunit 15
MFVYFYQCGWDGRRATRPSPEEEDDELSTDLSRELRATSRWLKASVVLSFIVMCLGSYVRAKDAGLSCPDWPLCYGQVLPLFDVQIFLEWFHRLLAAILVIAVGVAAFKILGSKPARQLLSFHLFFASVLLTAQIILGGLTVLQYIDPKVVSVHLINAVFFLGTLVSMSVKIGFLGSASQPKPTSFVAAMASGFLVFMLMAQIFIGGMVSTNFAGTVCPDFPRCFGAWVPAWNYAVWLQMSHRYMGFLLAFTMIAWSFWNLKKGTLGLHTALAARSFPLLVLIQFVLGMINVYAALPAWSTVLHLANALLMFVLAVGAWSESVAEADAGDRLIPNNRLVRQES